MTGGPYAHMRHPMYTAVLLFAMSEAVAYLDEWKLLATVLLAQTRKMQEAVHGLRNVKDSKKILDACMEINSLENQADSLLRRALAEVRERGLSVTDDTGACVS